MYLYKTTSQILFYFQMNFILANNILLHHNFSIFLVLLNDFQCFVCQVLQVLHLHYALTISFTNYLNELTAQQMKKFAAENKRRQLTTNINRKEKTSSDNLESFWNYFKKFDINSVLERNKKGTFVLIKSLNLFLFYYDLLLPLFSNLSASQRSFIIVHNINRLSHSCMLLRFDHMKCIIPLCGIKMKIA